MKAFPGMGEITAKNVRECIKYGYTVEDGEHESHAIQRRMEIIALAVDRRHDVQSLYPSHPHIWYLNAGDTYATTLIYNSRTQRVTIGCWGDLVD